MALLEINNLNFSYDRPVLKNLNMTVNSGDFWVLCGPCACGKTTFLRLIKHLIAPVGKRTGEILFEGSDVKELSRRDLASKIGYVFSNAENQLVCERPFDELAFGLENLGEDSTIIRQKIAEISSFLGIHHFFKQDVNKLSGGQKQLLSLASILLMGPKLLLLDEPTAMLDPIARENFYQILHKIHTQLGITIIICEHNLGTVCTLATHCLYMEDGAAVFSGTANDVVSYLLESDSPIRDTLPVSARVCHKLNTKGDASALALSISEGQTMLAKLHLPPDTKKSVFLNSETVCMLKQVSFQYEKHAPLVLNHVSLEVKKGEILGLLGDNGAGKTTLLSILSGFYKPQKGKIKLAKAGYLTQNPALMFTEDSIERDLSYFCSQNQIPLSKIDEVAARFPSIQRVLFDKTCHPLDLSSGGQQLLGLFKLILGDYPMLLLDEPSKGLDGLAREELLRLLKELTREGRTIVMVSHDLDFVSRCCDRAALLFMGEIVSLTDVHTFFSNNQFYTTSSSLLTRPFANGLITPSEVLEWLEAGGAHE